MTTPAAHGQLYPFDSAVEDWKTFIERAELYFDANGITEDAKKRGILLSSCGPKTFTMIKSIVAPTRPGEIPYGDLEQLIEMFHHVTITWVFTNIQNSIRKLLGRILNSSVSWCTALYSGINMQERPQRNSGYCK